MSEIHSKVVQKSATNINQQELASLAELAGIKADPIIFRIFLELFEMQVEPETVFKLLKAIKRSTAPTRPKTDKIRKEKK